MMERAVNRAQGMVNVSGIFMARGAPAAQLGA